MQLTIRYKTRYLDFDVIIGKFYSPGTIFSPPIYCNIVTACYYISEQQSFTSDVNIWEILPNEIQSQIEREIN